MKQWINPCMDEMSKKIFLQYTKIYIHELEKDK